MTTHVRSPGEDSVSGVITLIKNDHAELGERFVVAKDEALATS